MGIKVEKNQIRIDIRDKTYIVEAENFDDVLDTESLLQVDMNNIIADIWTFPVLFNRIGVIKAEIDGLLREVQLDFSMFEAELYKKHKKELLRLGEKATESTIDAEVKLDPGFKAKKMQVFEVQRQADIIDALYWAAKSKDKKLDTISAKLKPEGFELDFIQQFRGGMRINGVTIREQQNFFEKRR